MIYPRSEIIPPSEKPKVMLHYILPPKTSGPNTSMSRIETSWLKDHYQFGQLVQDERPGKIPNFRLLKRMIKQVRTFAPDIVHVSGLQSAGFYAVLAARLGGCHKVVTAIRGSSVDAIGYNIIAKYIFRYAIEPVTIRLSQAVYTVCREMSEKLHLGNNKKFIGEIHNPAPIINPLEYRREEFRKEICASDGDIIFICVGRMVYDKGISYIIEAIEKNNYAKFVFVGDGPYCEIIANQLRAEIENKRVFVLGRRNDVLRILSGCDVFLFATLHENLSNALLEACAMGLAIVATSVGGNVEVIEDGINGILIPPADADAIIRAINNLSDNRDKIKALGEAAKQNVENNFSQQVLYKSIKSLYDRQLR